MENENESWYYCPSGKRGLPLRVALARTIIKNRQYQAVFFSVPELGNRGMASIIMFISILRLASPCSAGGV